MSEIGKIESKKRKRVFEDTYVEWSVPNFFSKTEYTHSTFESYVSPAFFLGGVPFLMELFPRNRSHPTTASLYLKSNMGRKFTTEFSFSLKKKLQYCESVDKLGSGILKGEETSCLVPVDLDVSALSRQLKVLSDKNITLTCVLNAKMPLDTKEFDTTKGLKLRKLDKLSENFKDLFSDKESCDVTIKVQDKELRAHKFVLVARCSALAANFKHDTLENRTGVITIKDCDPDSVAKLLEYLYCGQLEELSYQDALNLYHTSDKYCVEELKEFCADYLKEHMTIANVCEILVFSDKYSETALFPAIQRFFNKNVDNILLTSEWKNLMTTHCDLANKLLIQMPKVNCEDSVPESFIGKEEEPSTSPIRRQWHIGD